MALIHSSASKHELTHRWDSSGMLSKFRSIVFLLLLDCFSYCNCFYPRKVSTHLHDWGFLICERFDITYSCSIVLCLILVISNSKKPRIHQSLRHMQIAGIVCFSIIAMTLSIILILIWMRLFICWGYVRKRSVGTKGLEWPLKFFILNLVILQKNRGQPNYW